MERTASKEGSPLTVDRAFLSSRLARELMASAYEQVAPIVRRSLARSDASIDPKIMSGSSTQPLSVIAGGQR